MTYKDNKDAINEDTNEMMSRNSDKTIPDNNSATICKKTVLLFV